MFRTDNIRRRVSPSFDDSSDPLTDDDDQKRTSRAATENISRYYDFENGIDLFKFYLRILIQANFFAVAINGSIITYIVKNISVNPTVIWALAVPFVISFAVFVIHIRSLFSALKFQTQMRNLQASKGFEIGPLMLLLPTMICIALFLHGATLIGTAALFLLRAELTTG